MRAYVDSSALIKRVVDEAESEAVEDYLAEQVAAGTLVISSAPASVEVARALRRLPGRGRSSDELAREALAGVAESLISDEVIALTRRTGPAVLRSLDALHLATALLADVVVTYDTRLADAASDSGLAVLSRPTR